ncbi:unnamed protein product [Scytosiphon promiscuus]
MKIALGTVQFGVDYGIANVSGQVSRSEISAIINASNQYGISTIDTASAYGSSEARLGEVGVSGFDIISKLKPIPVSTLNVKDWVLNSVQRSLYDLRVDSLYGLLLHEPSDLLGPQGIELRAGLLSVKSAGFVKKIGVSIYNPAMLTVLDPILEIDLVQVPFSPIDQRLKTSGWLERLNQRGIEVHTRSTFLQGLLLMPKQQRPAYFETWSVLFLEWDNWLQMNNLTALEGALGFVNSFNEIDKIVVGVDSVDQLKQIINIYLDNIKSLPPFFSCSEDTNLIDPSNWKLN